MPDRHRRNSQSLNFLRKKRLVSGKLSKPLSRTAEGESGARTAQLPSLEYRPRPWIRRLRNCGSTKATSNSIELHPRASWKHDSHEIHDCVHVLSSFFFNRLGEALCLLRKTVHANAESF